MLNEFSVGNVSFRQIPEQNKIGLTIGGIPLVIQEQTWHNIVRVVDNIGTLPISLDCDSEECARRCLEEKDKWNIGQKFALSDGVWELIHGDVDMGDGEFVPMRILAEKKAEGEERQGFILEDSIIPSRSNIFAPEGGSIFETWEMPESYYQQETEEDNIEPEVTQIETETSTAIETTNTSNTSNENELSE